MSEALPETLARVAEIVGEEAAVRLARALGGGRVYLPSEERLHPEHPLAQAMGFGNARMLVRELGSGYLTVPLGPAGWRAGLGARIAAARARGLSQAQVARELGIHVRTVERHEAGPDPRQSGLFD